jgi:hypothetical protein
MCHTYREGESTITNGSGGMELITVKDIVPYLHIADGNWSSLVSIKQLSNITYPLNAAVIFSDTNGEDSFIVKILNLSLSDEKKVISLQVGPENYYEGEVLKSFSKNLGLNKHNTSKFNNTNIYLELNGNIPQNYGFGLAMPCPTGCKPVDGNGLSWCMYKITTDPRIED